MSGEPPKTNWLNRLSAFWQDNANESPLEALHMTINQLRQQNIINEDSTRMLENVLKINTIRVRDIMIPRAQMVLIEDNWSLEKILGVILESGHSRYPVVDEEHKTLRGILLSKDLLSLLANGEKEVMSILRPATIVPESKALDAMLRDFKSNRNHMALVIDEYGLLSGLITIEDVIEEIVGEIDDEHDEIADASIFKTADGGFQVKALTTIEEFNAYFSSDLSTEYADTIGGYVLEKMGKMPEIGETLTIENWQVLVLKANVKRLILLKFTPILPE